MHFFALLGNFGDHGGVEMNAREEQIEIRVINEDKDGRRSLKATTTVNSLLGTDHFKCYGGMGICMNFF